MNIIICGAGKVGFSISKQLSAQGHSITVVDQSSEFIQKMNDTAAFPLAPPEVKVGGDRGCRLPRCTTPTRITKFHTTYMAIDRMARPLVYPVIVSNQAEFQSG